MVAPAELRTDRLLLRRWRLEDAVALRAALDVSDAHLRPFIPFMKSEPRTLVETGGWVAEHIAAFEDGAILRWAVWAEGALVGEVMLMSRVGPEALEVGYWLHVDQVGRGYGREAVAALVDWADSQEVERLEAWCDVANHPSGRLVERLGFVEARLEKVGDATLTVWARPRGG
ncbi:MAG: GNAT family N-acetyltransferase [Deltaproteobacteria bacterium]|nr:GNAT family N-acetyltransferase [Deltaproteobacteria bacterium]